MKDHGLDALATNELATNEEDVSKINFKPLSINTLQIAKFQPNNVTFLINEKEYIKITPEGFFVKGVLIKEDLDIYKEMKNFLGIANQEEA